MASARYTVSVDADLLAEFKRIAKERGRSQAFYINSCLRRVVESANDSELVTQKGKGGTKSKRKRQSKKVGGDSLDNSTAD